MIQLRRPTAPDILVANQKQWTAALMALVSKYGSYTKIPKEEKDAAIKHYRHEDIQEALKTMTNGGKCAFCETYCGPGYYEEVEHYLPKSIHPRQCFDWVNLLLSCKKCNIEKDNHDTQAMPLVHPVDDDPELFFSFKDIRIRAADTAPDKTRAELTIEKCDLRRIELFRPMAEIQLQFYKNEDDMKFALSEYALLRQPAAQQRHLRQIHQSLAACKETGDARSAYAGFMRYLLKNSPVMQEAVLLVNANRPLIGLTEDFEFR